MAMESYRDITTNIPDLFLGSGAPTAPPHVIFLFFRASTTSPEQLTEHPPRVAEMSQNHAFSRISRIFSKIMIFTATQGGCSVSCSGGVVEARKPRKMMRGGAVGAPESRNMLGMLVVMSL